METINTATQAPQRPVSNQDVLVAVKMLIRYLGEDPDRDGLKDTPSRVMKAWKEMAGGYYQDPEQILSKDFDASGYDQMVILRRYPFVSVCEHHMLPFIGEASIAYVPKARVVGLSKLGRLVDCFARRLQIQEAMTEQIANALETHVAPLGLGVRVIASHQCMSCRGVNKSAEMITTSLRGTFRKGKVRAEFLGQL